MFLLLKRYKFEIYFFTFHFQSMPGGGHKVSLDLLANLIPSISIPRLNNRLERFLSMGASVKNLIMLNLRQLEVKIMASFF
jgi:hypothetical protein